MLVDLMALGNPGVRCTFKRILVTTSMYTNAATAYNAKSLLAADHGASRRPQPQT